MKKLLLFLVLCILFITSCGKKTYTISFYDGDTLLQEIKVEQGSSANIKTPTKEGHTFIGWDKDITNVNENLIVHALWEGDYYEIKFYNEGVKFSTKYVRYGEDCIIEEVPSKKGYDFSGWDKDLTNITTDMEVNATFTKKEYLVTFLDLNDEVIDVVKVKYGEDAVAPTAPTITGYVFVEWDNDFTKIDSNITVKAIYRSTVGKISYYVNGSLYDAGVKTYNEGEKVTLPVLELEGYDFLGWRLSTLSLTLYNELDTTFYGDISLYAYLIETSVHNPLVLPSTPYHFTGIRKTESGVIVYQPVMPTGLLSQSVQDYNWSTSDPNIASVSIWSSLTIRGAGYCILTATLKTDPNYFINCVIHCTNEGVSFSNEDEANNIELVTVTFVDQNNKTISTQKVVKGGSAILPKMPDIAGYAFYGFDHDNFGIKEDTTFKAIYLKDKTNNLNGKTISILGDSISTFEPFIPSGFASFYPYPTADVNDVNMTWWMQVINKVGGRLFVNNSYSGTCVADLSSNATKNIGRINYNLIGNKYADVLIIYMGSNDCASGSINEATFKAGYKQMLDNIKKVCPNQEIILMTLTSTSFYSATKQKAFNNIIREYASSYKLRLVDVENTSLDDHKVDSAHPDYSGMKILADAVINELIK